jgi:hypothetical protein
MKFNPGDIIRFTYKHQSVDEHTGPPNKEVLVLHPNWGNKIHGIDLKRLSPAERKVLEIVLDPEQRDKPSRIPLINNIRKRMDPIEEIQNPQTFYAKFVRPFLNGKDAYRQYIPHLMTGTTRMRKAQISTGKSATENPLFGKLNNPLLKKEPEKPLTAIDQMKQAHQQHGGATSRAVQQAKKLSPGAAQAILKKFGG